MGTTHYLVDHEGRNALCVEKWYALQPADWDDVTEADLDDARECDKVGNEVAVVLRDVSKAWIRDIAQGRKVGMCTDNADHYPWQTDILHDIPGWTVYEVTGFATWRVSLTTPRAEPKP